MNPQPLQLLIGNVIRKLLFACAALLIQHRLADPDAAHGIEAYADPLAALFLAALPVWLGHIKDLHLYRIITDRLERLSQEIDHIVEAKTLSVQPKDNQKK